MSNAHATVEIAKTYNEISTLYVFIDIGLPMVYSRAAYILGRRRGYGMVTPLLAPNQTFETNERRAAKAARSRYNAGRGG